MKKLTNIAYCLIIALWPVVFILGIDRLERYIRVLVSQSYNYRYNIWLWIACVISGLIFAAIGFSQKDSLKRIERVAAHIVAAILVMLVSIVYVLYFFGVHNTLILHSSTLFPTFTLGYSVCAAIKAVVIFRKHTK
jgi:hypothetical protein